MKAGSQFVTLHILNYLHLLVIISHVNNLVFQVSELEGNHKAAQEADALQMEIIPNPKESLSSKTAGPSVIWHYVEYAVLAIQPCAYRSHYWGDCFVFCVYEVDVVKLLKAWNLCRTCNLVFWVICIDCFSHWSSRSFGCSHLEDVQEECRQVMMSLCALVAY